MHYHILSIAIAIACVRSLPFSKAFENFRKVWLFCICCKSVCVFLLSLIHPHFLLCSPAFSCWLQLTVVTWRLCLYSYGRGSLTYVYFESVINYFLVLSLAAATIRMFGLCSLAKVWAIDGKEHVTQACEWGCFDSLIFLKCCGEFSILLFYSDILAVAHVRRIHCDFILMEKESPASRFIPCHCH